MKKLMYLVMFAVMLLGTIATGYAEQGDWRGGIRTRVQEAKQKINQGIERGTLNRHEAGKLNEELSNILYKIDRMKADGQLSQGERDNINNDLNRLDRDIFKEKHDAQVKVAPVQGDWRGGIRARIQESKLKIDRGIKRGTITRYEARQLNNELSQIRNRIDRMNADGRISKGERIKINRNLDILDRNIAREKRDDNRRR